MSNDLKHRTYSIPLKADFPLLDAFTVDINYLNMTAILWVIQITTSRSYGGSALGYEKIRRIIAKLKAQLWEKKQKTDTGQSESHPSVEVRFLLVIRKGHSTNLQWVFQRDYIRNDHRGDVYCLELPHPDEKLREILWLASS